MTAIDTQHETDTRPKSGTQRESAGASSRPGGGSGGRGGVAAWNKRRRPGVLASRETIPARAETEDDPRLSAELQALWDANVEHSRLAAAQMQRLAEFWVDADPGDLEAVDQEDLAAVRVAAAERCTVSTARRLITDAHTAVVNLPGIFARLAAGDLPEPWLRDVLRVAREFTARQLGELDDVVSSWDLQITCERFRKDLRHAAALIRTREPQAEHVSPAAQRRVDVFPMDAEGLACLQVIGPAPEILACGKRLQCSARAVQAAQRHALTQPPTEGEGGEAIPFDDGTVRERGKAMPLAQLCFDILTSSIHDTGAVQVPTERFRINVTVPAMTLLGASDAPATLDGVAPLPAELARDLAGGENTWYRILTDPTSGAFLPLPAEKYVPTVAMREHLRLRNSTCAVPGCTRSSSWASECDHIQEYNHHDPTTGGLTEIENLHLLCGQHHQMKTSHHIDPERLPPPPGATRPGTTRWRYPDGTTVDVHDDVDLMTPAIVEALQAHWRAHETLTHHRTTRAAAAAAAAADDAASAGADGDGDGADGDGARPPGDAAPPGEPAPPEDTYPPPPF